MTPDTIFSMSLKEFTALLVMVATVVSSAVAVYWWFKSKYKTLELKIEMLKSDIQKETSLISRLCDNRFLELERERKHCMRNNETRFNSLTGLYEAFLKENKAEHKAMIDSLNSQTKATNLVLLELKQHLYYHKGKEKKDA